MMDYVFLRKTSQRIKSDNQSLKRYIVITGTKFLERLVHIYSLNVKQFVCV